MPSLSPESAALSSAGAGRWLALIGIGEDGRAGLSPAAARALDAAEWVIGGARHLALAAPLRAETRLWDRPIEASFPAILARRGRPVCVLASGDPFLYGVGVQLAALVPPREMAVYPQPSSVALACARLGWGQAETALVTLHGRALERVIPHLQPGARILALSWDAGTPTRLAALLSERGFGGSTLHVLQALGGPRERIATATAEGFALAGLDPLNLVAIEVVPGSDARVLPLVSGRSDDWFAHDGQISKAEIRAITLAALSPRAGELLWDVGAGSGSVGLEWCLAHPRNRTIAFEQRPERATRIGANALGLGALPVEVVAGAAPDSFAGRPEPDAVFIGGGLGVPGLFEAAWDRLRPGGRLVVNVVTLEGEARLGALYRSHGGALRRIALSAPAALGPLEGWRAAFPVTQWRVVKP